MTQRWDDADTYHYTVMINQWGESVILLPSLRVHYTHDAEKPCQHMNRTALGQRDNMKHNNDWHIHERGHHADRWLRKTTEKPRLCATMTYRRTGTQTEKPTKKNVSTRELACEKTCVNSENAKQRELISTTTGTKMQGKTNWAPTTPEEFSKFSETCETETSSLCFAFKND